MIVVSFSGGRTSARMSKKLLDTSSKKPLYIFANTGQEKEETLEFVDRCDKDWGLDVVWVEAVIHHKHGIGTTHRVVNFETACRDGRLFEDMIIQYGIPNKAYPHCTRELKLAPIYSYLKAVKLKDFQMAIGLRADERGRAISLEDRGNIIYPLIDTWPMKKSVVIDWWRKQDFDLNIQEFEGNCTWCWKKSMKKHFALIESQPEIFSFTRVMEKKYPLAGSNEDGTPRVFFRGGMSTDDLFDIYQEEQKANPRFAFDCDDGCSDSCDIHAIMAVEKCGGF